MLTVELVETIPIIVQKQYHRTTFAFYQEEREKATPKILWTSFLHKKVYLFSFCIKNNW